MKIKISVKKIKSFVNKQVDKLLKIFKRKTKETLDLEIILEEEDLKI